MTSQTNAFRPVIGKTTITMFKKSKLNINGGENNNSLNGEINMTYYANNHPIRHTKEQSIFGGENQFSVTRFSPILCFYLAFSF